MVLKFYVSCFIVLLTTMLNGFGQSAGLRFAGHEVVQDKRTALDLSVEKPLCFDRNFALEFDLSFMPGYTDYFGYIFRIIDQDKRNIDLVYDMRFVENKHFKLVMGDQVTDITFDIDINKLYKNWYKLTLNFDLAQQELVMVVDGKSYRQRTNLKKGCYKILFGANNYKDFDIKDVPPMSVRDIRIKEGSSTSFYWPLTEKSGSNAAEQLKNRDAFVANPVWIKKMHHDWELLRSLKIKGAASVALNPLKEELYIVSEDSLLTYNIVSHQLAYTRYNSGKQNLMAGNQSIFNTEQHKLCNFYIDQKLMASFNFSDATWDKKYISPDVITNYWHPNKFYCPMDSSLYMIGGYGQYTYRKSIERFHFPDQKWTSIPATGEFTPRYLSALGKVSNGAYILGGYGSSTGQQILNPRNIYDLNFYDVRSKTFKKLFELTPKSEEFAFANSMIVDEKTGVYHALTFPNSKYNSSLQMIEGSIHSPAYKLVGGSIPYAFHDIHSFADLFYCPSSKKYVAAVLFHDIKSNLTSVKIYTLHGPPELQEANIKDGGTLIAEKYLLLIITVLIILFLLLYIRKRIRSAAPVNTENIKPELSYEVQNVEISTTGISESEKNERNAVLLFGNLQLFDKNGEDVTKYFSPLLRELFLVVLLYTIMRGRGISSEKLTEILWFDKSADSARNNRSVNIAKLKTILEKMDGCQISKETGYWKINLDKTKVRVDYLHYLHIVNSKQEIDEKRIDELTEIINRGSFLSNVEYDWLDSFKSEISNEIIDTYLHYAATIKIADNPEFLIKLTNSVFHFDPVNEEAMIIKCKALVYLGKHSLAKIKFETFSKEYKAIYGEDYKHSFQEILV